MSFRKYVLAAFLGLLLLNIVWAAIAIGLMIGLRSCSCPTPADYNLRTEFEIGE